MKQLTILLIVLASGILMGQAPYEKYSEQLKSEITTTQANEKILCWIFFTDKGNNVHEYISSPNSVVSEKSLKRRSKVLSKSNLLSYADVPVNEFYLNELENMGISVKQKSKWFNGVSAYVSKDVLSQIASLNFVKQIDIVYQLKKDYKEPVDENKTESLFIEQPAGIYSYNYGNSYTQLEQIGVPAVHNLGITGQGVTVAVMDAGFNRLSHESFQSMNIIAAWDFVNNDPGVGDSADMGTGTHGTQTLSTIGGFKEGKLIGPAFTADYILAKTENTDSETPIEEDNWIAAVEWADSIGVDVTSTSLGYITFDAPFQSYTWQSMDGNTCRITIAADLAVARGIVVVNSAGNEGFHSTQNTLGAPADGDSVIAVGAVGSSGTRVSFSSVGNTVDGRIKPDVMAMGSGVVVASTYSNTNYSSASGTSFSCPLAAGVAALILSHNPSLTPMQVRDAMRNTASRANNPDREYGWGILNTLQAISFFPVPVELTSFKASVANDVVTLNWETATETNNRGFEIERAGNPEEEKNWITLGFVKGNGSTTNISAYSFTDEQVVTGTYTYRLKQIDFDGSFEYSNIIHVVVDNPGQFSLSQNYPNPFNPVTNIKFSLPVSGQTSLKVYDMLGREVKTLINKDMPAGNYEVYFNASGLPSGIYFYTLTNGNFTSSNKMTLLK